MSSPKGLNYETPVFLDRVLLQNYCYFNLYITFAPVLMLVWFGLEIIVLWNGAQDIREVQIKLLNEKC